MEQMENEDFDQEAKNLLEILETLQTDSDFFMKKGKDKNIKFSIEKDENEISPEEREIRWH